ncbi:MAG: succinate dehydrogenase, cytochrome b556 subunit [Gammaproteobacteria bacterium]|nr:succinate dehydrogenase, cytochrome b556 subunit [Gammaproteobacteria bacterium]
MSTDKRPVNLNLFTMKFPVMAIASILHRIAGFIIFFLIPICLYLLQHSLSSIIGFSEVQSWFQCVYFKIIMLGFLTALLYYLLASIRHFMMDFGFAESLKGGRISAWVTFALTVIGVVLMGYWLW